MLCVLILYISGGTYSLKSIPNDRFSAASAKVIINASRISFQNVKSSKHIDSYAKHASLNVLL